MKILFIGDIFGKPGRKAVRKIVPKLKEQESIDFVIANVENLAHGKGATPKTLEEMRNAGVDFFTSGNHIWKNKTILDELESQKSDLIRPANYPLGVPGFGYRIVRIGKKKVLILNLIGRVFFNHHFDCPFRKAKEIIDLEKKKVDLILIDFHAEATSEKIALKHYLDGQVTALLGTHTHIPTADAVITAKKTAYITDVGMVGPLDSVIGIKKDLIIQNFLEQIPVKHEVEEDSEINFGSVLLTIDDKTNQPIEIKQIVLSFSL